MANQRANLGDSVPCFEYTSFKDRKTCLKYFYKYVDAFGRMLKVMPKDKCFPYVSALVRVVTGSVLHRDEIINGSLFPRFYNAICDANRIYLEDNEERMLRIHRELTRQFYSACFER